MLWDWTLAFAGERGGDFHPRDAPGMTAGYGSSAEVTGLVGKVDWNSREWEIRLAFAGVVLSALALWFLTIRISEVTSY